MPPLLVIPALPVPEKSTGGTMPELPALSEMLRLSDAGAPDAGWRSGMLRDLGFAQPEMPEAVVAAHAFDVPLEGGVCLAAPVHAVAGLHRVHLHAAGVLALEAEEKAAFAAGFAAQFGPEVGLREAGNQWLLTASFASAAEESDPLDWRGAPLERRASNSPSQKLLRRLGAEIEMWLADLPLNAGRRSRGRLPVNLLWLWGGGAPAAARSATMPSVRIQGPVEDPWLAGVAALAGSSLSPPVGWSARDAAGAMVLAADDAQQLQALESQWFRPALDELRSRRLDSLRLRVGTQLFHVRPGRLRRLLRRARPWWQALAA